MSLSVTTATEHVPIDFELYLPRSWTEDPVRRREARIPDSVQFKTKTELALDMIRRAIDAGIPAGVVLADAFYGRSSIFRSEIRWLGLEYIVGVDHDTKIWRVDKNGRRHGAPVLVSDLAKQMGRHRFRQVTWRDGTKKQLQSDFAFESVLPAHDDGFAPQERETVTLIVEWEDGEPAPNKYYFAALNRQLSKKRIVRLLKQRWRTERVYEDLKGELGFDHFEGRRYAGWHHHVSVALSCFAFIVAERARRFSPQAPMGEVEDHAICVST